MTTLAFIATLGSLVVLEFALRVALMRLGLRLVNAASVSWRRVMATAAAVMAVGVVTGVLAFAADHVENTSVAVIWIVSLLAYVVVGCVIVAKWLHLSRSSAITVWLAGMLSQAVLLPAMFLLVRPYAFESYTTPTNSMAPTLLGDHLAFACPTCGEAAYATPHWDPRYESEESRAICENFHRTIVPSAAAHRGGQDRFLVARFLTPDRWDLLVFRLPSDPQQVYVKRIVGMPGETIHIQDGDAWANGERLTPPQHIREITYVTELPGMPAEWRVWGRPELPAVLGSDEYFVLGDFTTQAADSRVWDKGARGRPTYAVPEDHIIGVVTHTYWPPERWRVHR